jgi:SAM-dependent methyltransferase
MPTARGRRNPPLSVHAWLRYAAIERLMAGNEPKTVLEIGVGQGAIGVLLARRHDYVGIDLDEDAIDTARGRFGRAGLDPARLLHGGLEQVRGRTFDLVCAFEVLEHVEDDEAALAEWRSFLAPGGRLIISVPAGPGRFGTADEKAGHFRRYSRDGLAAALGGAGFEQIRTLNYGYPAGYALEAARNVLARRELRRVRTQHERTLASGRWLQPGERAAPVTRALAAPLRVLQRPFMGLDVGTGIVAAGTRR